MVCAAWYSGMYDHQGAGEDLENVALIRELYNVTPAQDLGCWIECHLDIEANAELITEMAEALFRETVLSTEYFEELMYTSIIE